MPERKKLELELNKPITLELLFDSPVVGQSQYGEYYLYACKNGSNTEYSFFAPDDVHPKIKDLKKGERFEVIKTAQQVGKKLVTRHDVRIITQPKHPIPEKPNTNGNGGNGTKDTYYEVMLLSYQDALKIQEQLNGMVDVNRVAITLFIARSKINSNGFN